MIVYIKILLFEGKYLFLPGEEISYKIKFMENIQRRKLTSVKENGQKLNSSDKLIILKRSNINLNSFRVKLTNSGLCSKRLL